MNSGGGESYVSGDQNERSTSSDDVPPAFFSFLSFFGCGATGAVPLSPLREQGKQVDIPKARFFTFSRMVGS